MKSKLVPLYELGEIVSGSTPDTTKKEYWDGDIPWITPADLTGHQGIFFTGDLRKITELGYKSCSTKIIPSGSILFSSRAPIGHCAVTTFPLCTNQGFKNLIPNNKLNPIYGYFALKYFTPQIESLGRGATFTEVNKELFENVCIPLPPLLEQQRIAAILQKADRLRQLRRYARQLSDGYLQSVFLEMFGGLKNQGWEEIELTSICKNITDGTHDTPPRVSSGIPFITSKNIKAYEFDLSIMEYVTPEIHFQIIKRCNPKIGDILFTNIGANIGNAVINCLPFEFSLKNVALIQPNEHKVNSYFLESLLNNPTFRKNMIAISSAGGVQPFISLDVLRNTKIKNPPMILQKKYQKIVEKYNSHKLIQKESSRQTEILFQSLLQRAFRGEL